MSAALDGLVTRMQVREADLAGTTGTLTRHTARGAFDVATATYAAPTTTTVYTGDVLVRPDTDAQADAGDGSLDLSYYLVKFPADTDVQLGDIFTVSASVHDAGLVGVAMRCTQADVDEFQVVRRAKFVTETARPA